MGRGLYGNCSCLTAAKSAEVAAAAFTQLGCLAPEPGKTLIGGIYC